MWSYSNDINFCEQKRINKRKLGGKCISIYVDSISNEYKTPYEKVLLKVFGKDGVSLPSVTLNFQKEIMEDVFKELKDREVEVLKYRYGVGYDSNIDGKNLNEMSKIFGVNIERIRQIENKIFRKLRNPIRCKVLLGSNIDKYYKIVDIEFINNLKSYLISELVNILKKENKKSIYIDNILNRYNVLLCPSDETSLGEIPQNIYEKSIDECELSFRAYVCLQRAGIDNVGELLEKSDEEIKKIRNIGSKCYKEVSEVRNMYSKYNNQYCSIIENKIVYAKVDDSEIIIAKAILNKMLILKPNMTSIFDAPISSNLLNILLKRGYMFEEDVFMDAERLIKEFRNNDDVVAADELDRLLNFDRQKKRKVYLYSSTTLVSKFIDDNNCKNASDIIAKAKFSSEEDVCKLANNLVKEGF